MRIGRAADLQHLVNPRFDYNRTPPNNSLERREQHTIDVMKQVTPLPRVD